MLDADLAAALDGIVQGPRGRAILDAAARILAMRAGEAAPRSGHCSSDVGGVVTAFPLPLGVELAAGALADRDERAHAVIEHYVQTSPSATRDALQRVAATSGGAARTARDLLAVLPIPPDEPVRGSRSSARRGCDGVIVSSTTPTGDASASARCCSCWW